jgi:hypothetical protein
VKPIGSDTFTAFPRFLSHHPLRRSVSASPEKRCLFLLAPLAMFVGRDSTNMGNAVGDNPRAFGSVRARVLPKGKLREQLFAFNHSATAPLIAQQNFITRVPRKRRAMLVEASPLGKKMSWRNWQDLNLRN